MSEPKLFRVRPNPPPDASEEKVVVIIDKSQAEKHGIELDEIGWPTVESLAKWHAKNNPPKRSRRAHKSAG